MQKSVQSNGVRLVRSGPHRCSLGSGSGGDIVECTDCGRFWRYQSYANYRYDPHWVRVGWLERKLRGIR